jgi:hypothetical protein
MKSLFSIVFFAFAFVCQSQNTTQKKTFKNQGEQEKYWATEFFKKNYQKTSFKAYTKNIEKKDSITFVYGDQTLKVFLVDQTLESLFSKGIFYPQLINGFELPPKKTATELAKLSENERVFYEAFRGDLLSISNIKELPNASDSTKVKRFQCWVSRPKMANPQVYLFELTNEKATQKTTLKMFIENATLTFFKAGWVVI